MKKHSLTLLPVITCIFIAFTAGLFLGGNQRGETVYLTALPSAAKYDSAPDTPTETTVSPTEVLFPVNINSADLHELSALPGIGPVLAQRILDHRTAYGSFERPEELLNVEGIGSGKLEAIFDYITTGG